MAGGGVGRNTPAACCVCPPELIEGGVTININHNKICACLPARVVFASVAVNKPTGAPAIAFCDPLLNEVQINLVVFPAFSCLVGIRLVDAALVHCNLQFHYLIPVREIVQLA